MLRLSLNVLLTLIIQSKITGKGKIGNGRLLIKLLQTFADSAGSESYAERNILSRFNNEQVKSNAYHKIDMLIKRFLPDGKYYPYEKITFTEFERSIGDLPKCREYNYKMKAACNEIIDKSKIDSLVYMLLEIIRQDDSIGDILYGGSYIPKEQFFGNSAHPKQICFETLLIGLIYHTHKNPVEENTQDICLLKLPKKRIFRVVRFSDDSSLNVDLPLKLEDSLRENAAVYETSEMKYRLEIRCGYTIISELPESGNIFLYGTGGAGKTTLLMNQININNSVDFYFSLYKYKREIHENLQPESCWILLQILLKYHYQYEYQTYEACTACESERTVLQHLAELKGLLKITPIGKKAKYTLLLDGINEIPSELQGQLVDELNYIVSERKNVRIIITGRTVPRYAVFDNFQQLEICGVSDIERDKALSGFADISMNTRLLELLKTPLFLNMYLESDGTELNTRGEILDSYIMNLKSKSAEMFAVGIDNSLLRFIVQYILPCAAKIMFEKYNFVEHITRGKTCYEISRGDLFKAIDKAFKIYILDEYVYQSYIAPKGFRKNSLLESREKFDFIELILENIGLMKISENDPHKLHFTHQYFRDYFATKHILNLLEIIITSYKNSSVDEQKEMFRRFELDKNWFFDEFEIYKLFGEICGDYKNIPNGNDSMWWYHSTILDIVLDMYRKFDAEIDDMHITDNIIKTMSISRNNLICEVNFDRVPLPFNIPCNIKFSQDGKYPCSFKHCIVDRLGICDDSEKITASNWEKYAISSPDKKQILIILDNNYILLWDNISEEILWDDDISRYTDNHIEFGYAEFSQDGEKIIFWVNEGHCHLYTIIVEAVSGRFIGYRHEFFHDFNYTEYHQLDERLKLKISEHLTHFKNCDFSGAKFIYEDYSKILYHMRALTDNKEVNDRTSQSKLIYPYF